MVGWYEGKPDPKGLGYSFDMLPGKRPYDQYYAGGSKFSRESGWRAQLGEEIESSQLKESSKKSSTQYRRLAWRMDAMHDIHSQFARDLTQTLGIAFRATGVDIQWPMRIRTDAADETAYRPEGRGSNVYLLRGQGQRALDTDNTLYLLLSISVQQQEAPEQPAAMGKLDDFEAIIGEAKTEGLASPLLPHIMYVDAPESCKLRIVVTDFKSSTWMTVKSVIQLEDMRDDIGIGGPWSEFLEYVSTSINSRDTKIVFEGQSIADGPAYAKLVAQKSKGMPLVCFHLNKLVGGAAVEATGNVSQELFKAYKSQHELLVKEQEGRYQLTEMVAAEQAKSEILQRDLNLIWSSKRHKSKHLNERSTSHSLSVSTLQQTEAVGKEADVSKESTKVVNRVVPAYHRAKVRGVLLHDKDDDADI
ncbi:uncharacterized protein LOC141714632 [Apium graveolens]|uniref:uncharacterized protein LOC141714632 n=1 Tax=Apium graveolens TaxID=4045 RepID=UPI003D7AAF5E